MAPGETIPGIFQHLLVYKYICSSEKNPKKKIQGLLLHI